ncbi:MAG: hypothetical protein NT099_09655 [Candidatus Saganbacteria bacterium]|nr:hypothetical protein [Candidatus Saganbacteria bacterium]
MRKFEISKSTLILGAILAVVFVAFVLRYAPLFVGTENMADQGPIMETTVTTAESDSTLRTKSFGPLVDPFALRVPVSKLGDTGEDNTVGVDTVAPVYTPPASVGLGGIWVTDNGTYALIGDASVVEGDVVDGWKVKKINADNVVLTKNGETKILRQEEN